MSHKERQEFLKTSELAKLFGVDHLLPEIEDWVSPPPKSTKTITVKARYVGRTKPLSYYLEDDE